MDYVALGRTGLRVSVAGLGSGGRSKLGQKTGATTAQSIAIVRRALDLGINVIDTARDYGTEELVGEALSGAVRLDVVLSTKIHMKTPQGRITGAGLTDALESSLTRLRMDYVDVYHLHGIRPDEYDYCVEELVPAMLRLREQGKVRFLGITESFSADTGHVMMARAVRDAHWDVVMVGFNILNQSARGRVFAETRRSGIGVLCMHAVRDALSRPEKLRPVVAALARQGLIDPQALDLQDPLGFLNSVADSLPDASYRFCRAEPGIDVVLHGTGNLEHLEQNVASMLRPALPDGMHRRLVDMFASVDTVSGQETLE